MTFITVRCPPGESAQSVKRGKAPRGTPRYLGQNTAGARESFRLDARNRGCWPPVQQPIMAMRLHARGVRATARGLRSRTDTVLSALKKKEVV